MLLVGLRTAGFEGTLRVSAYSSVTSLVGWIPHLGWRATLREGYLAIVGVSEVHAATTGKTARTGGSGTGRRDPPARLDIGSSGGPALSFNTHQLTHSPDLGLRKNPRAARREG